MTTEDMLDIFKGRVDFVGTSSGMSVQVNRPLVDYVQRHLDGVDRLGFYNLLPNNVIRFAVIDFDSHQKPDAYRQTMDKLSSQCEEYLRKAGLYVYREISKSGYGNYHLWIFFDEDISAKFIRSVLSAFIIQVLKPETALEIFPKQNAGDKGNFIWLPFFGKDVSEDKTVFIDASGKKYDAEFKPNSRKTLDELADFYHLELKETTSAKVSRKTDYSEILSNGVPVGERNNTVTRIAGHLKHAGLPISETKAILQLWNKNLASPLSDKELCTTVRSIYSYSTESAQDTIYHTGGAMLKMPIPVHYDLVEGLMHEQSVNFLSGEEGCGKSLLAMNLAISVASGKPNFLGYNITKHGKVLFLNNELGFPDFLIRFQKMSVGLNPEQLDNFITPTTVPPLNEYYSELDELLAAEKPCLLVLDCLYWSHDLKENDSSEMKSLMRQLISLRDKHRLCILVVHHTKKGSRYQKMHNDNMRGAGVFGSATDSVFQFRRSAIDDTKRLFKPTKLRHGADGLRHAHLIALNDETLWFCDEGKTDEDERIATLTTPKKDIFEIDFSAIMKPGEKVSRKEILEKCKSLGCDERTIDRKLKEAKDRSIIASVKNGQYTLT